MKIVIGERFWIPRVGGETFKRLVNDAKLDYDKARGFQATAETDLKLLVAILEDALNEDVAIMLKCFICGTSVECEECRYNDVCKSTTGCQTCLCKDCEIGEILTIYSMRFTERSG